MELPRQYMVLLYVEDKKKLLGLYCPKQVHTGLLSQTFFDACFSQKGRTVLFEIILGRGRALLQL